MRLWPHVAVLALLILPGVALVLLSRRRRGVDPQVTREALEAVAAGRPLTREQMIAAAVHTALNPVEARGVVTAVYSADHYEVVLTDGRRMPALRGDRMWHRRRKVTIGDPVLVRMSIGGESCIIRERLQASAP
ncbi:hypothetical protein ABZS66_11115 [Dactylosporangium sp. NPDC005572]|uniref:hypothetical protein n=1 Tax=Dactylosporangium sp. NPDC005572 TaxID=3156889 RepID=UPI0033A1E89E